jgi:hypothetical protein
VTQFSLFGAEAAAPGPDDLDGLLLAGAQWVRSAAGARLSVVVTDRWRADAIAHALSQLQLTSADTVIAATHGFAVRTAFSPTLLPYAARWTRGANQGVPAGFALGAGGLRLWAVAAGRRDDAGYLLATAAPDDLIHRICGAQLARLGVAAVSISQRGGPGWRVTSARRLRRLGELLGPTRAGGGGDWPIALGPGEPLTLR